MKHIYILALNITLLLTLFNCNNNNSVIIDSKEKERSQENLNILICSDLSNRLTVYNKPESDVTLISRFLDIYPNKIYHSNGRKKGQKDIIKTLFLNIKNIKNYNLNSSALEIDLSSLNKFERVVFVKDTVNGFTKAKQSFKKEVTKMYNFAKKKPQGADLYSLFNQKLDSISISKKHRNILLLFTDGYIEYGSYEKRKNKSFYLDETLISSFRRAYKNSSETDIKVFFDKNKYGIEPVKNSELKNLEVLALEFYDRSLSANQNATQRPTDYEIMNLFWEDWMKKSKVKFFKSYRFDSVENFEKSLINFIEHSSK